MNSLHSLGHNAALQAFAEGEQYLCSTPNLFLKRKNEGTLDACCDKKVTCVPSDKRFFPFNLDAKSSAEDFNKLRSGTRSLSSFWEKDVDHC